MEVDSFGPRVGNLEARLHTVEHQVKTLENEKLPHRVGTLEGNVGYLMEVAKIAQDTQSAVNGLTSYVKGAARVFVILFAILTLAVAAAGVVVAAYGLLPKFDAVVVQKSPSKATIKE
jgi:hypothetical protein